MPGVDDPRRVRREVDAHELPCDEVHIVGVTGQRLVGDARLLGEADGPPASVARSTLESNVSSPTSPAGASQPGQRELARFELERGGKQPVLDLGLERERQGALPPHVEVGVAPGWR